MRGREYWEEWLRRNADAFRSKAESIRDWYRLAGVSKGERRMFRAAMKSVGEAGGRRGKGRHGPRRPGGEAAHPETPYAGADRHRREENAGPVREGRLRFTREGRPLVIPDSRDEPAIRIPGHALSGAWPKDRVRVRLERRRGGMPPSGRIVQVVERGIRLFVGRYSPIGARDFVRFRDREADLHLPVTVPEDLEPQANDLVLAEVDRYPRGGEEGHAQIIRVLGKDYDMGTIFLAVVCARDVPVEFSDGAINEAKDIPHVVRFPIARLRDSDAHETVERVDLRDYPFVTIDGDDARDFDDAVCLVQEHGRARILVAIADVSRYVALGSRLDRDAFERGTSVYFPDRAVPMLPPALSEGVCSLKPGVNRLTMTVDIPLDAYGRPGRASFYPSVIRSRARLTYGEVHAFLTGGGAGAVKGAIPPEIGKMLRSMEAAAGRLTLARSDRGALDFDLPEAKIVVENDFPARVEAYPRWEAHRLIEEFMLLANTAVAEFLSEKGFTFLSRIHEPPAEDRMEEFEDAAARLLRRAKVTERRDVSSRLQAWTEAARGGKYERYINVLMLRSLMLARYGPEQAGHFGLALSQYTHFTSPIRRYPDLVVHRVLKAALGEKSLSAYASGLKESAGEIGRHLSARERAAMDAERDVEQRAKALHLSKRTGETFTGVISSIVGYGFFVELAECFAEGFVHISSLRDDDYRYSAERGEWFGTLRKTRFSLGDRLRVRLRRADVERGEIDLVYVEKLPDTA
ncbi:MAG: VacB/RNase II family 3'-5' exoribonuclease [Deltaproteobacteria bacterium]|nr:VacB/RNase II family 3'-5' exoribonuclease [Deltaproteobacteria bacterium]